MPKGVPANGPRKYEEDILGVAGAPSLAYRIPDGARKLGIATSTLYQMRQRGLISFIKLAGRVLVTHEELQRVLAEAKAGGVVCQGGRNPISPTEEDRPGG